jgi:hypothetical protein
VPIIRSSIYPRHIPRKPPLFRKPYKGVTKAEAAGVGGAESGEISHDGKLAVDYV